MKGVINLGIGEPDFNAPSFVSAAARRAIARGFGKYTANAGMPELKEEIAKKLKNENGILADPKSEIIVTAGATQAIFVAMNCLLNPGDEVLLPTPIFPAYRSCAALAGASVVEVPSNESEGFQPDFDTLERRCCNNTKLVVINTPCNPTGVVLTKKSVEKMCEFVDRHQVYLIADEIYEKFLYDGAVHFSAASIPEFRSRVITINGFAKTYGMTGWRLGYAAASPEIIGAMNRFNMYNAVCANSFAQVAGIAALRHSESFLAPILSRFRRKREDVCEFLDSLEWEFQKPAGSFYIFPKIPQELGRSSLDFSKKLLTEQKVATIPGIAFGTEAEGHVRISYSVDEQDLKRGLGRIKKFAKK